MDSHPDNPGKFVSPAQAVGLIRDGDAVVTGGFVGTGSPDLLFKALAERFRASGHPRDLTYTFPAAPGDGNDAGINLVSIEGLVRRVVFGHIGMVPRLQRLIVENRVEGYNLPLGVIAQLYRDIAAGKPGTVTAVGLGTFADPEHGGGRMNEISCDERVRRIDIDGHPYLLYRAFPLDIALVRGTTADPDGNVSLEDEALNHGLRSIAAAVRNHGGKVIVQVKRRVANGTMTGRQIHLPACLVDAVVLAEDPSDTGQTYTDYFNPTFCGDMRVPNDQIPVLPLGDRKVIARRAALELSPHSVINLGIGMPEGVAAIASEEGLSDYFTLTTEAGVIGGVPCGGVNFGVSYNPEAFFSLADQFDFYDGGGLDAAFLGLAQVGPDGSLNVSRFGNRIPGFGGFVNISQNARKVVFMGTFSAVGAAVEVRDGALRVLREGSVRKFVNKVEQISFNGAYAASRGANVLYVTERCVFRLTPDGLELAEVAPGIDIDRDILAQMDFRPIVRAPQPMDPRIFRAEPMGLTAAELARRNDPATPASPTPQTFPTQRPCPFPTAQPSPSGLFSSPSSAF